MNNFNLQEFLLLCTVINLSLEALWGLLMVLPHGWMYDLMARAFRLTPAQFDLLNLAGIYAYKLLILVFNVGPYLALRLASGV